MLENSRKEFLIIPTGKKVDEVNGGNAYKLDFLTAEF